MGTVGLVRRLIPALAVLLAVALLGYGAPVARATSPNPIAGDWGLYTGPNDNVYPPYAAATGKTKQVLGRVALHPRAVWYNNLDDMWHVAVRLRQLIADTQHGDPNALVQLSIFREYPDGESRKNVPLTPAEQQAYRDWTDVVAQTIGNTRTLLVLEPDLAMNANDGRRHTQVVDSAVRLGLVNYAARTYSALPRTTVYLDAGASDWMPASDDATNLIAAGVQYARGIAIGATHAAAVGPDVAFGAKVIQTLAARGYPGKTMIEDTSDNGRPYTERQFIRKHHGKVYTDDVVCKTRREQHCMTLGVPPTDNPSIYNKVLHLTARQRADVAQYVDAYIWFGRPWIGGNGTTHTMQRLIGIAKTTPYQH